MNTLTSPTWQLPRLHWAASGVDGQGDPTGPIHIGDTWHVFTDCARGWCHATSTNGVYWTDQPPLKLGGAASIGTGSWTQLPNGTYVALYCGGDGCGPGLECLGVATSDDPRLVDVYDHGIQAHAPPGLSWFRDPARGFILNHSRLCTVMGAGAHDCDRGGAKTALLCTNSLSDLHEWRYLGNIVSTFTRPDVSAGAAGDGCDSGGPSCPDFFRLPASDRWALLMTYNNQRSSWFPPARWLVGSFDESSAAFVPEASGLVGGDFDYVPKTGASESGDRRLLWANIGIAPAQDHAHRGVLSLSRELSWEAGDDGEAFLAMRFIPELKVMRRPSPAFSSLAAGSDTIAPAPPPPPPSRVGDLALIPLRGTQLELRASFPALRPGETAAYGLAVLTAINGSRIVETTRIGYDPNWRSLFIDTRASCAGGEDVEESGPSGPCIPIPNAPRALRSYPLDVRASAGRLDLVVYVDGGLIEVCANNRSVIASFAQTSGNASDRAGVFGLSAAEGARVKVEAWLLRPAVQQE